MKKRTGIYGGSFNPIHVGHVCLAKALAESGLVDEMWLLVSPQNPFKADANLLDDQKRLHLARLATRDVQGVEVCDREFTLPRPSYMYHTLQALSQEHPDRDFVLVIGADNWLAFDRWRAFEEFLTRYHLIVYPRPGYEMGEEEKLRLGPEAIRNVRFVDAPLYDISSTEIREDIAAGREPAMLNPRVFAYILEKKLYL